MFQSTHPRGVRQTLCDFFLKTADVSIHAPAWGATGYSAARQRHYCVSIHAPAWGATHAAKVLALKAASFNPRTRVGCDDWNDALLGKLSPVSIHAPAWGATLSVNCDENGLPMFQSTHPRGVRHIISFSPPSITSCFNPRTRVGCDLLKSCWLHTRW